MIKVLIIDDEQSGCDVLGDLLQLNHPEVSVLPPAQTASAAIASIEEQKPDLIFLDINLGHQSGFEVLSKVKWSGFHTIFVTAYSQYALDAFKVSAVDYLLKPVSMTELAQAIEKFKERAGNALARDYYENLANQFKQQLQHSDQKLVLLTNEGHEIVRTSNVLYFIAEDNYTQVYVKEGKPKLVAKTLKHFEESLPGSQFLRIHKSFIVNLEHIVTFNSKPVSYVKMLDGKKLEVSRRRKHLLVEQLNIHGDKNTVS